MKTTNNNWIKPRHRIWWKILLPFVQLLTWFKYHPKLERWPDAGKRQVLVLMNHQTPFDQFFVGISFRTPLYYIATEDIFSLGFVSGVIRYLVAPIPIKKFATDLTCLKNCIRVVKEGGSICLAPEGNTTYSGVTGYMKPGIVSMARKFSLPVVIYKIEGGYGKHPRWADDIRKGPMRAGVSRVIEPEEYKSLSDTEFMALLQKELFNDECCLDFSYTSPHLAEYLERALYVCPTCGLSEFESHGDLCSCKKCGLKVRYKPDKTLEGVGADFPFHFIKEWYDYQCDFVNHLKPGKLTASPVYTDIADVYTIDPCVSQKLLHAKAALLLFGDRIEMHTDAGDEVFRFDALEGAAVQGRNKLEISAGSHILQFRGSKHFNALKYLNFYHRYKNVLKGDENVKFLGL